MILMAFNMRPLPAIRRKLGGLLSVVLLLFACGPAGTTFERQDVGFTVIMPGTVTCGPPVVVDTAKGRSPRPGV